MRKLLLALAAVTAVALTTAAVPAAQAAPADTATVSVVHGIPDTPVNVFVDGKITLKDFEPGTVAGPLQLAPGSYDVTIYPASNTTGSGKPVIAATASLQAGQNVSLVAHLTADGSPTLTPYVNDVSSIAPGQARLIVRHDAAAPAVDVRANGKVAFADLTNPKQAMADLPAGSVSADVVLAGTSTVVLGPQDLNLAEGTATIVYAVGSADDKTLSVVAQTISGLGTPPSQVPAGTGGTAASAVPPVWLWAVGLAGVAMVGLGFGGVARARTARVRHGE